MTAPPSAAGDTPKAIQVVPRDPRGNPAAFRAARERSMSERLELAISWNAVAAELRAGLAAVTQSPALRR